MFLKEIHLVGGGLQNFEYHFEDNGIRIWNYTETCGGDALKFLTDSRLPNESDMKSENYAIDMFASRSVC